MVTSDKTGDEDTEGAINELADDLLKGDSESVTDALAYGQRMHRRSWTGCCGRARALEA